MPYADPARQREARNAWHRKQRALARDARRVIASLEAAHEAERRRVAQAVAEAQAAFRAYAAAVPHPSNPLLLNRLGLLQEAVEEALKAILR